MVVRLDYGSDVEEYEEALAFHAGTNPQYRWLMWRNANTVFVRSIDGRACAMSRPPRRSTPWFASCVASGRRSRQTAASLTLSGTCRCDPGNAGGDADPCTLMGALVEAAVYTLATRIPVICQDDTAAALSQLVAERLEHYRLLR